MSASEGSVIVGDVAASDPLIGQAIGQYVVKSQLGDGGMAVVFLAEHQTIGRKMAVKVLKADVAAQSEWGRRFIAEAQVVAALKHRNIVEVFDFGQLPDGRQFLMMEYVEGQSLADYISEHAPLIPAVALDFVDQILNALGEAHKKGIVHRDLKPANVMLVREHNNEPLLKVLDFGLARQGAMVLQVDAGSSESKTSLLAGTPAYVAPEQALGEVVDGRADLYALGVMLFEMLTGELPFDAVDDRDLVQMHVSTRAPGLEKHLANAPEGLAEFVASLLVKERTSRPANADVARQIAQRIIKRIRVEATAMRPMPSTPTAAQSTQKIERATVEKPHTTTDLSLAAVRPSTGRRAGLVAIGLAIVFLAIWAFLPATPVVVPVAPVVVVEPPTPPPGEPVVAMPPDEMTPLPNPVKPLPVPVPVPAIVKKQPIIAVQAPAKCVFDDRFRDYARRTRDELRGMVDPKVPAFAKASDVLSDALVERDCTKANAALTDLKKVAGASEE
jgi:eukaryotic-like serine/threonine-protein kinase